MIVQSGSMSPAIKTGSIVMVKPAHSTGSGQADYKIGDIITFGTYSKTKAPTTHRIFDIKVNAGVPVYITKGDANNAPDQKEVSEREIIGKVLIDIPYLGYVVHAVRQPIGFIAVLIIPAAIIIGDEVRKIIVEVKSKQNKKS